MRSSQSMMGRLSVALGAHGIEGTVADAMDESGDVEVTTPFLAVAVLVKQVAEELGLQELHTTQVEHGWVVRVREQRCPAG